MKSKLSFLLVCALFSARALTAQTTTFTYQGRLNDGGAPADGLYAMQFTLFDALTNGNQVGPPVSLAPVPVTNGLFTATLDFGASPFTGADRWLGIAVNLFGSDMVPTRLRPRQALTATPYAIRASNFGGTIVDSQLSANVARLDANQTFSGAVNFSSRSNTFAGAFNGDGAGVSNVNLATVNSSGAITVNRGLSFLLSSSPAVGDAPYSVVAADVNGDGRLDLISADQAADTLSVLMNNGSAAFTLASSPPVGDGPVAVAAADVSGDGHIDLISVDFYAGRLSVLFNNGSGAFTRASAPSVGREPSSVTTADVNGDGRIDLVTANARDDTLSLLTNDGSGGFVLARSLAAGDGPISVTAADFNGDGRIDLISANRDADTLSVLVNQGNGLFTLSTSPAIGHYPFSVTAADVNRDGRIDVISADLADSSLSVLTNNGSGGFVLAAAPAVGSGPYSVVAADVNGDGHVDLINANQFGASLSVLMNDGRGAFAPAATLAVGEGSIGVTAADLNGDGRTDLVSANWQADTLSVLLHNAPTTFNFAGNFTGTFTGTGDLTGTFTGAGAGLSSLNANSLTSGTVPSAALDNAWKADGNFGTSSGTHFLGTTDDQPLELKVSGMRALRLEPNASGEPNVIGGSPANFVAAGVVGATIAGGGLNGISSLTTLVPDEDNPGQYEQVTGDSATIGGGTKNSAAGEASTIGGGAGNTARGDYATIAGGLFNRIEPSLFNSYGATIGGGSSNTVNASSYSIVAGGLCNAILGGYASVISGGTGNQIDVDVTRSFIGGGADNVIEPRAVHANIAGGEGNRIGSSLLWATIGGGQANSIGFAADGTTIGGGRVNEIQPQTQVATISGGEDNHIESHADYASIAGGRGNLIASNATAAVIAGGFGNYAGGPFSFAAGRRARTEHTGAFVWADAIDAPIRSTANNQLNARASGGVRIFTDTNATTGAELAPGSGTWSSLSDRNAKENFTAANGREILEKVAALPMASWNYRAQGASVRHLGPMAQDFHAAFGLGESARTITTVDADGVALAAIQGLNNKLEEEIKAKDARIAELERRLAGIEKLLDRTGAK